MTGEPNTLAEESREFVRVTLKHLGRRESQLREQAARVLAEADRARRQLTWLDAVQYDDRRDVFTTPDGIVAAASVRVDRSTWPLISHWYDAHPEERSNV